MIPIPLKDENVNEIDEQKFIETEIKEKDFGEMKKYIYKLIFIIFIFIILIISIHISNNNSLNTIEKITEINNINKNKANLSIIINSFNEKNDLISLTNDISKKLKNSEIILTTSYSFNNNFSDTQKGEMLKNNISIKIIEYKENTNKFNIRITSASRAKGDYIIYIDPEEPLSFDILNSYQKYIKDDIDVIQYDLNLDNVENNKIIYQPQIYESLFYSRDSISYNHFHINGKLYKKEIVFKAIKKLDKIYLKQSNKYFDEIMIVSLFLKEANSFIKLKNSDTCNRKKCQKNFFRSYKYNNKEILRDTVLFVRFMFEYSGKDKVQEKRMAVRIFDELLIYQNVKSFYNSDLLKLISDTCDMYINCELINDMEKEEIRNYKKSLRK